MTERNMASHPAGAEEWPCTHLSRRVFLSSSGGALALAAFGLPSCSSAPPHDGGGRPAYEDAGFLHSEELDILRAVVERFIPGPPEDPNPGAVEAGCAEGIDALLGAFSVDPPLIWAGGPFSPRGGGTRNDFDNFIPLDRYDEFAWRIRIEGSQGIPEREFNGPVKGWQQIYREGLAQLDARARQLAAGLLPAALSNLVGETQPAEALAELGSLSGIERFADLPPLARDVILRDPTDETVQALVETAWPQTLELMYGPPEYGGNRGLVGWGYTKWEGDVQPRGYTDEEVSQPERGAPSLGDLDPRALEAFERLGGAASPEAVLGGTLRGLHGMRS